MRHGGKRTLISWWLLGLFRIVVEVAVTFCLLFISPLFVIGLNRLVIFFVFDVRCAKTNSWQLKTKKNELEESLLFGFFVIS
jgi:hypothetical protein